ncbi:hypothetical protein C8Q80DRAFT_1275756 [Daedaleopsis nitida]|nr:hypothetical protein C8Q80DRAFT_1275756 [Daedaleopsis nitida]
MSHQRRAHHLPAPSVRYMAYPKSSHGGTQAVVASRNLPHHHYPLINTRRSHVDDIPPEVLCKIFAHMVDVEVVDNLPPWQIYRHRKGWLQASAVCRSWRAVAISDSSLWRVIDVGRTGKGLPHVFGRVPSTATVEVTLHHPGSIPRAMKTLLDNAHRIKKLIVVQLDHRTLSYMDRLLSSTSMPALTELWINTLPHVTDTEHVPRLQPHLVPNLRFLEATHLLFDWTSPIISRLHSLYLGRSPGQVYPHFEGFLRALSLCQNLRFLKIDRAYPLYSDDEYSNSRVSMPNLHHLELVTEYPWEVRQLLSHLHLSVGINLKVRVRIDLEGSDDRFAVAGLLDVLPQDATCLPLLRTASHALIKDFDFQCWAGPGAHGSLSVTFEEVQADAWQYSFKDAVQQFARLLARAPLTSLAIVQEWSDPMRTKDLARLLYRFPHIRALEYSGLNALKTDLTAVLTAPPPPVDGAVPAPGDPLRPQRCRTCAICVSLAWNGRKVCSRG